MNSRSYVTVDTVGFDKLNKKTKKLIKTLKKAEKLINEINESQLIFEAGATAPPFHNRCRCTTISYFDDEFTEKENAALFDTKTVVPDIKITFTGDIRETADIEAIINFVKTDIANELSAGFKAL